MTTKSQEAPTLISLFSGAGGLDVGLEQSGFNTLVTNDFEDYACKTLLANQELASLEIGLFDAWLNKQLQQRCYKNVNIEYRKSLYQRIKKGLGVNNYLEDARIIKGDIRQISSEKILQASGLRVGDLTLLAGGPPCQPFSRAGKRETIETDKGQLFIEFVRVINDLRPRWFLFENVKGLILSKTDVQEALCISCNRKMIVPFEYRNQFPFTENLELTCVCGSSNFQYSLSSQRDGSLQIIINEFKRIGYTCSWKVLNAADFGAPQIRERLIIVGSRDNEKFIWPEPLFEDRDNLSLAQTSFSFDSLVNKFTQKESWLSVRNALWPQGHPLFGKLDQEKAVLWVKNVVRPHDEPVTWRLNRPSPTIGAHQSAKLAIAPDGVPEEQLKRQQWHVLGHRQGDTPPVSVKHAYLSDAELLRLQTFPESWYLFGTRMQRAFQIGNAVPPVLGKVVGEAILRSSYINYPLKEVIHPVLDEDFVK